MRRASASGMVRESTITSGLLMPSNDVIQATCARDTFVRITSDPIWMLDEVRHSSGTADLRSGRLIPARSGSTDVDGTAEVPKTDSLMDEGCPGDPVDHQW